MRNLRFSPHSKHASLNQVRYYKHCAAPHHCDPGCAYDSRCRDWYLLAAQQAPSAAAQQALSEPYINRFNGRLTASLALPIWNTSDWLQPRALVAVMASAFHLDDFDTYLAALPDRLDSARIVVARDDAHLTLVGTRVGRSTRTVAAGAGPATTATVPLADASDAKARALGRWLLPRRDAVGNRTQVAVMRVRTGQIFRWGGWGAGAICHSGTDGESEMGMACGREFWHRCGRMGRRKIFFGLRRGTKQFSPMCRDRGRRISP